MRFLKKYGWIAPAITLFLCLFSQTAQASEIDLKIPLLDVEYNFWGHAVTGSQILLYGLIVCALGMLFGFYEFCKIKKMPAHKSMLNMASLIYETCKTYMKQQAVLLGILEAFIAVCIFYYFFFLNQTPLPMVMNILLWSVLGILGSFSVAWFGMRINTYANARTAFASLKGKAFPVMSLPLRSGMSIGVLLICVELVMMIIILLFIFAAEILGELGCYFITYPYWDSMLHTTTGFLCAATGFALIDILNRNSRIKFQLSPVYVALAAFCFSMTVGVMWEFFEFGMDRLFHMDMQKDTVIQSVTSVMLDPTNSNIPVTIDGIHSVAVNGQDLGFDGYLDIGLYDTMEDLFVNFVGAVVFSTIGYFYIKHRGRGKLARAFIPTITEEEPEQTPE